MSINYRKNGFRFCFRYFRLHALFTVLLTIFGFTALYGANSTEISNSPTDSALVISATTLHLLLSLIGALVVICSVIVFLIFKIRKVNRELTSRNLEIEEINQKLTSTNRQLALQKEIVTK